METIMEPGQSAGIDIPAGTASANDAAEKEAGRETVGDITVDNPRRFLAFVPKRPRTA